MLTGFTIRHHDREADARRRSRSPRGASSGPRVKCRDRIQEKAIYDSHKTQSL